MGFQDDVLRNVNANRLEILRFYVDSYHSSALSEHDRAQYRAHVIEGENNLLTRDPTESAKLQVVEYLDAHPSVRAEVEHYVHEVHRLEQIPQVLPDDKAHGYDPAPVMREGLERLEAGFLGALVQGIANTIWDDPHEALLKAAPWVTAAELLGTHGEALQAKHENANSLHEKISGELHHEGAKEIGAQTVADALGEIGSKTSADQFPAAAEVLGHHKVEQLEAAFGHGHTDEILTGLHPAEPTPGYGAYKNGDVRHPETPETDKHVGMPPEVTATGTPIASVPEHTPSPDIPFEAKHSVAAESANVDSAHHHSAQHHSAVQHSSDQVNVVDEQHAGAQHFLLPVGENTHLATHPEVILTFDPIHGTHPGAETFVVPVYDMGQKGTSGHESTPAVIPFEQSHLAAHNGSDVVLPPHDNAVQQAHHGGATPELTPGHHQDSTANYDPTHSTVLNHDVSHASDANNLPDHNASHHGS